MITGTPGRTEGMTNTDTLRAARFFRFALFFLAATSICMADSTSIADMAMIDMRNGLTICDSPFVTAGVPSPLLSGFENVFVRKLCEP
jgi:hypothetical protein